MAFELDQDTIYQAYDRFVCAEPDCAGITAGRTGRTIDGHRLLELTTRMVIEWYRFVPNVTLTCECGRLEAVLTDGQPIIRPRRGDPAGNLRGPHPRGRLRARRR